MFPTEVSDVQISNIVVKNEPPQEKMKINKQFKYKRPMAPSSINIAMELSNPPSSMIMFLKPTVTSTSSKYATIRFTKSVYSAYLRVSPLTANKYTNPKRPMPIVPVESSSVTTSSNNSEHGYYPSHVLSDSDMNNVSVPFTVGKDYLQKILQEKRASEYYTYGGYRTNSTLSSDHSVASVHKVFAETATSAINITVGFFKPRRRNSLSDSGSSLDSQTSYRPPTTAFSLAARSFAEKSSMETYSTRKTKEVPSPEKGFPLSEEEVPQIKLRQPKRIRSKNKVAKAENLPMVTTGAIAQKPNATRVRKNKTVKDKPTVRINIKACIHGIRGCMCKSRGYLKGDSMALNNRLQLDFNTVIESNEIKPPEITKLERRDARSGIITRPATCFHDTWWTPATYNGRTNHSTCVTPLK